MVEIPELTDGKITLRLFRPQDAGRVCRAVLESLPELSAWLPWCHEGYAIRETRAWLASREEERRQGREYDFSINAARGGLFLGGCGLNRIDGENRVANLGYWVRSARTGRGVATAAARLLLRFGFGELGLKRIEIMAAAGNRPSLRVAEKLGAVREGVLRERVTVGGTAHDVVLCSLLVRDLS